MRLFSTILVIFFVKYATSSEFECPESDGFFADFNYCDQYYICNSDVPELQICPNGLVFNASLPPKTMEYPCVHLKHIECGRRALPEPANSCPECSYDFETKAVGGPAECNRYRICSNGVPKDLSCPENLAFNVRSETCEWSDLAEDCDIEAFTGFKCPKGSDGQFFESPYKCDHYFMCNNGKPRWMICANGKLFDPTYADCVDPEFLTSGNCFRELKSQQVTEEKLAEKPKKFKKKTKTSKVESQEETKKVEELKKTVIEEKPVVKEEMMGDTDVEESEELPEVSE